MHCNAGMVGLLLGSSQTKVQISPWSSSSDLAPPPSAHSASTKVNIWPMRQGRVEVQEAMVKAQTGPVMANTSTKTSRPMRHHVQEVCSDLVGLLYFGSSMVSTTCRFSCSMHWFHRTVRTSLAWRASATGIDLVRIIFKQ